MIRPDNPRSIRGTLIRGWRQVRAGRQMNYQPMTCPKWRTAIHVHRQGFLPVTALFLLSAFHIRFYCPTCETRISINADYSRWTPAVIVLATILFAWFTRTPNSSGTWLLSMILVSFILRTGFLVVFPPPSSGGVGLLN